MKMHQVVEAIHSLGRHDLLDYIAVIAPLMLSVVAVGVSVYIMHKQNRVALFQMRYNVVHYISLVLQFADASTCWTGDGGPIPLFNSTFGTNIAYPIEDSVEAEQEVQVKLNDISKEIMTAQFVFSKRDVKKIEKMMGLLRDYTIWCIEDGNDLELRDNFCKYCSAYQKKDFKQLKKRIRL